MKKSQKFTYEEMKIVMCILVVSEVSRDKFKFYKESDWSAVNSFVEKLFIMLKDQEKPKSRFKKLSEGELRETPI
jgi:hypothetical protein